MERYPVLVVAQKINHKLYMSLSGNEFHILLRTFDEVPDLNDTVESELILIDAGENNEKGIQALKYIKQNHSNKVVIFITDKSSEDVVLSAFREGAREFLRKPLNLQELRDIIRAMAAIKKTTREKRRRPALTKNQYVIPTASTSDKPSKLLKVLFYMDENLHNPHISLSDYAKAANLSKFYFCRYFKKYLGVTPVNYVLGERIRRSMQLLSIPDMSLTEIAYAVGFENYSGYYRIFKKITGLSPQQFRKRLSK